MSDDLENVDEPMSQMDENAVSLHELYLSYMRAGFSESQAFDLAKTWMICAIENADE